MRGGARQGAGRKPKEHAIELIERLTPLDDLAFKALRNGIAMGDSVCLKLFMSYRFGMPIQKIDANVTGEFQVNWKEEKTYAAVNMPLHEINN